MNPVPLNMCVDFLGDFPLFLDHLPGEELAQLLTAGLAERGTEVLGVEKKRPDIGYCVGCLSKGRRFRVCVTARPWGDLVRWQLLTQPATRRGPRSLRGQADLDALAHLQHNLDETVRQSEAIWDVRWFARPEEPDHLDIQEPDTCPVRAPEADAKYPAILHARRSFRAYAVLLAVAYYFVLPAFVAFGNVGEETAMFLALVAFGTILLYGLVIPWFLAVPISGLAVLHREKRLFQLTRRPKYPWPRATSAPRVNRCPQFSLRALLIVVTATSVFLAVGSWIDWWRLVALAQLGIYLAHGLATIAPFLLILPGMPLPNEKVIGKWVVALGALFVSHVLATVIVVEMLLQTPMLLDLNPYDGVVQATLNWTVPYVAVGLLIAGFFWQQVRGSPACMAGCGLATVGLVAWLWYGHRFWCDYCGYDLSELSEIAWWM
jgi:uncharacterized membrane protein (DUF485 family)